MALRRIPPKILGQYGLVRLITFLIICIIE
jgi:hypothetical protein